MYLYFRKENPFKNLTQIILHLFSENENIFLQNENIFSIWRKMQGLTGFSLML